MNTFLIACTLLTAAAPLSAKENTVKSFHDFKTKTLEGAPLNLDSFKGKVVLVVNTASECGYTPQYAELEALYKDMQKKGVVVLGFPSNDFGGQEPGDAKKIRLFCDSNYKVTFPLTEKVVTKGAGASEIYRFLSETQGEPKWNFHKYLVGKDGKVLASFPSSVEPRSEKLKAAIDSALAH
jgi:glutathione peroxidase